MPRWTMPLLSFLGLLGLVPFLLIARARVSTSTEPRIHVVRDMDYQDRFQAQQKNPLFADQRAMRMPVPGTVARGELNEDTHLHQGRVQQASSGELVWANTFPAQVLERGQLSRDFLERGRERYEIFCAPCHGYSGRGDGMVEARVAQRKQQGVAGLGAWATPTSYLTDAIRAREVGYLFFVASKGVRNMAGYENQIPARDRWAIVAYVRALQYSQQN